jgi:hypothetical protein
MKAKFLKTQGELADALQALRVVVKEVGGNYLAGLQSDVARLQQLVKTAEKADRKHLTQMARLLKAIASLDIRPEKGRRRDLKELDRLISKLSDAADNW